jgi:hypothetical protein
MAAGGRSRKALRVAPSRPWPCGSIATHLLKAGADLRFVPDWRTGLATAEIGLFRQALFTNSVMDAFVDAALLPTKGVLTVTVRRSFMACLSRPGSKDGSIRRVETRPRLHLPSGQTAKPAGSL